MGSAMDLFSPNKPKVSTATLQQLKLWTAELLGLDPDIPISISQLQCHEPGCPPLETVIAVMETSRQQYKLHKAAAAIDRADLAIALGVGDLPENLD